MLLASEDIKQKQNERILRHSLQTSELRNWVKVEVAVLGSRP